VYPPANEETIWAVPEGEGAFRIDSVPFFVRGVSCGDVVSASRVGSSLVYQQLVREGGHSTVRVLVSNEDETQRVREELRRMGCTSESTHIAGLVAVDIPANVSFVKVRQYLANGEATGRWEYEEACIAHTN